MVEKTRNPGLYTRDFETVLRRSIAAAAIVDVPATVLVAVITLSRLLGDTADEGARYTADRRANRSATNIACYCTPDNCAGGSADTGALLGRRAACNRKSNQSECNNLLNQILLLGWSPSKERWPSLILVFVMLVVKLWRKKSSLPSMPTFRTMELQLSSKFDATGHGEFN